MEKDRVVDTLYFGTFAKAATVYGDSSKTGFVYCPGPKAVLKLIENDENLADLSQPLLEEKLTTLSTAILAEHCGTNTETIN